MWSIKTRYNLLNLQRIFIWLFTDFPGNEWQLNNMLFAWYGTKHPHPYVSIKYATASPAICRLLLSVGCSLCVLQASTDVRCVAFNTAKIYCMFATDDKTHRVYWTNQGCIVLLWIKLFRTCNFVIQKLQPHSKELLKESISHRVW